MDFSATEFPLTLSDIRPSGTFTISILNDNMFELTESFVVSLYFPGGPVPRVTLKQSTATVTIYDDDCKQYLNGVSQMSFQGRASAARGHN